MNKSSEQKVITRFPPSPTGSFHVGSARTALFNYLFARKNGGEMVMRFEDTDEKRSKKEYEEDIVEGLSWLGIGEFGALFRQSERTEVYAKYIAELIEQDKAYISEDEEGERDTVIRFRNPGKEVVFEDLVRSEISFNTTELGDFIIAKSLDEPLYHLAVVVDDYEMGVTHVIRGEDHISNTPRQILIQQAFGAERPQYAHLPLILGPDKAKLSKRHGATSITEYKKQGFLPAALTNYLALLGWHPSSDQEIFSMDELVDTFSLDEVQKGGAVFDIEKLRWFNRQYIQAMPDHDLAHAIRNYLPEDIQTLPDYSEELVNRIVPVIRERIDVLSEIEDMAENGDFEFYFERPGYHAQNLLWRDEKSIENTQKYLKEVKNKLEHINVDMFNKEKVKAAVWEYASDVGRGNVLWPMRYALSGKDESPGPFELAEILGKEETLARIEAAIEKLGDEQ